MQLAGRELMLDPRSSMIAGLVAGIGTVALTLAVPAVDTLLAGASDAVLFGAVLLLSSGVRILAGVFGARSLRRRAGIHARTDSLAVAVIGVIAAALAYGLLITVLGAGVPLWRTILEVARWGVEGALGAFLVTPGEQDDEMLSRRLDRRA